MIRELLTYNEGISGTDNGDFGNDVDLPFQQTWYYPDERWEGNVFFTAPTSGINHETTFNVSGLVALSDMNLTVTPGKTIVRNYHAKVTVNTWKVHLKFVIFVYLLSFF